MRRPGVAPSVPGKTVATPFSVMHHLLLFFLLLLPCLAHGGKQWQLENYELCRHEILSGIPAEASGVTYSQVTNSLWVITRRPPAVFEYDLRGRKLREVSHRGLRDPEGITWMYGYTFAVAQEGGGEAAITIMDIVPWKHAVEVRSKLVLREVRCNTNFCFEGITYDVYKNVFYAVQEMDPMKVWMITPSGRATEMLNSQTRFPGMRDLADTYLDPLSSRLFVVSQTEQKVAELSWDGEVKQIIPVEDNMVEGLTFTPDGDLMITVGEPNDLWVYTSTGDCDWHPEEQETRPEPAAQQNPLQLPIPVDEDIDGGYCSWESCKRVRQGSPWCHGKIENCVRGCGGIWCWWNAVGGVISKEDLPEVPAAAPENIRSTALLTREWVDEAQQEAPHEDSVARKGFCTWSSCSFGQQAEAWCSQSPYNCVKFCEGSYCWADGLDPPITASNIDKANSTSATQVRDTSTTTNILARPTGRAAEAELSQVSQPTSLSAEEPELQTNIGKRFVEILDNTFVDGFKAQVTVALHGIAVWQFTPLQQLYFRESVAKAAYGNQEGFLQVVFNNTAVDERNAVFSGILSIPTVGDEDSVLQELVDAMSGGGGRKILQVDSPQDVETESSATEKVVALTVHLLGETQQHANSLATGMSKSVENGQLQKDMYSLGFKHNLAGIEMISIHIEGSGVAPQYYPAMHFVEDDAPYASFSQDYKEIEVVVVSNAVFDAEVGIDVPLKGTKNKKLFGIGTPVVVGAAVGASLVVLAVVFLVFRLCKKAVRSPDQNVGSPCGSTASRPSLQIATHVSVEGKGHEDSAKDGMDSPPVSTADVSQATNRVQLTAMQRAFSCIDEDVASSFTAKGSSHRRLPSEILQGQGLLSMQDLYTPATTPGHSRQGSTMVDPGFDFTAAAAVDLADVAISSMSGMDTQQQPTGKDIPSSASTANLLSASEGREL